MRIKCVSNGTIVRYRRRRNRHPTIFLCHNSIWLRVQTRRKSVGLMFIYDGGRVVSCFILYCLSSFVLRFDSFVLDLSKEFVYGNDFFLEV